MRILKLHILDASLPVVFTQDILKVTVKKKCCNNEYFQRYVSPKCLLFTEES